MDSAFPFYSSLSHTDEVLIYHTHPLCRIAQKIAVGYRMPGTGEARKMCPFCFLLGEFQANRALRKYPSAGPSSEVMPGYSADAPS